MTTLTLRDLGFVGGLTGAAPATDPLFSSVSLLLHGDATPLIDSSGSPKAITAVGGAAFSTTQKKFGDGSIAFNGTTSYLSLANDAAFNFGTGDATLEAWVYLNSTSGTQTIASKWQNQNVSWIWQFTSSTMTFLFGTTLSQFAWTATQATWVHLAISRSSGSIRFFVNGVQTGSTLTNLGSATSTSLVAIGANNDGPQQFLNGYVDDLRITKSARYVAGFTPPSAAFPDA